MSGQRLPSNARLAVRFVSRWQNYFAGDVATFPARMAASLVSRGKAEAVNIAPADATPPAGAVWATRPPGAIPLRRGEPGEEDFVL
jgi:hypothetical protein